ncbi:MAG TPA: CAP domain-containing protein [bacterium]|nr:CAP domain-containing protein [bacterium]
MSWQRVVAVVGGAAVLSALVTGMVLSAPAAGGVITVPAGLATSNPRLVPRAEVELFGLLNRARARVHESPLAMDPHLRSTARALSQDMALHGFLGHVSSSGATLLQRLSAEMRPGTMVGENVGLVPTVEEANRAFLASPVHRTVMLYPAFRYVGIGITTAGNEELVITEDFAQ